MNRLPERRSRLYRNCDSQLPLYNTPVQEPNIRTVILPPTNFYETIVSAIYMGIGGPGVLLGYTRGEKDIQIRDDAPDYGHSLSSVRDHEQMHNHSEFNSEGNTPEHEESTRDRCNRGVYPQSIYSFPERLDYMDKVVQVNFRKPDIERLAA